MSSKNGGPAFPVNTVGSEVSGSYEPHPGMTLRDYFAAKALQGMLANDIECRPQDVPHVEASAYILADAMLAERSK